MWPKLSRKEWSGVLGRKFRVQSSVLGILIGLGCIAVLVREVNLKQSWHALSNLQGQLLLVPLAVLCLNLPLRAWRWQLIFPAPSRPKLSSLLIALGIGNMANFLLPGRAGDFARCALAGPSGSLAEASRTLATLAVEKILDGLALIGLVLFTLWALHPPSWVLALVRTALIIFGGVLIVLIAMRYQTHKFIDMIQRSLRRMRWPFLEERFESLMTSFADGLSAITSSRQLLVLLVLTIAIWISEACLIWGLSAALGIGISLQSAVMASAVLGLGFMIPAAPGGLGTYELFGTEAFKIAGVPASGALTLTVVIHAWVFVANVVAGLAFLAIKGITLAQLRKELDVPATLEPQSIGSGARPSA